MGRRGGPGGRGHQYYSPPPRAQKTHFCERYKRNKQACLLRVTLRIIIREPVGGPCLSRQTEGGTLKTKKTEAQAPSHVAGAQSALAYVVWRAGEPYYIRHHT